MNVLGRISVANKLGYQLNVVYPTAYVAEIASTYTISEQLFFLTACTRRNKLTHFCLIRINKYESRCLTLLPLPHTYTDFVAPNVWTSYQIRTIAGSVCAGNAGNVFPTTDFKGNR